jgi:cellulose biosynthesis protein BcsE
VKKPARRPRSYTLGIAGLPATARGMLPGRLYAAVTPPSQIAAQCLAGSVAGALRDGGRAVAVLHSPVDEFLALLAGHSVNCEQALASGQLIVLMQTGGYGAKMARHGAQHFVDELDYYGVRRHSLVAVESAERLFSSQDEHAATAQARIYQRWFGDARATGLLLFQAPAMSGAASFTLRALDGFCAGLAHFRADGAGFSWQIEHWLSPLGSIGRREFGIGFDPQGALLVADGSDLAGANARIQQAPDQDRVIATAAVVAGERGVPEHWRIVKDLAALLEAADGAIAATCLIDFHGGDQLRVLARAVHHLRRKCGRGLRIVVRERSLRLRYNDELLLLRLGANTVVYAEVGFSRFISLLESLRGQAFAGEIPDHFESAVLAAMPPPHAGYLTAMLFCDMVRDCLAQSAHIGVESTLVCLYLLPETTHLEALRACRVKRQGDLFTADDRSVWMFLYACREPDVDVTLERVYSEPLAQTFEGHVRFFSSADILGAIDGLESRLYASPVADYSAQLVVMEAAAGQAPTNLVEVPLAAAPPALSLGQPGAGQIEIEDRTITRRPLPLVERLA